MVVARSRGGRVARGARGERRRATERRADRRALSFRTGCLRESTVLIHLASHSPHRLEPCVGTLCRPHGHGALLALMGVFLYYATGTRRQLALPHLGDLYRAHGASRTGTRHRAMYACAATYLTGSLSSVFAARCANTARHSERGTAHPLRFPAV